VKKLIFPILMLLFSLWLIRADIPFLWMYLHKKEIRPATGIVTQKYKKPAAQFRGGSSMHYFIRINGEDYSCSGISRISKTKYDALAVNTSIPVKAYDEICLATFDVRMYTPPFLHFLSAGMILLVGLIYFIIGLKDLLIQNNKSP